MTPGVAVSLLAAFIWVAEVSESGNYALWIEYFGDWDGRGTTYLEAPTTTLGPRGDLDRVDSPSVQRTILSAVRETVDIEGPISMDRLARDVGRRFGLDRVSAGKRETIVRCIPAELIKKSGLGDFVWPKELTRLAGVATASPRRRSREV
ncbi:DUF3320 domain-containing protein [Rhodococcus erythropolis]|uniref:DUF3320 domain-containing protein n=1 Tax=Rhodococcus erythropolis TaxID=1833 RepID=UPI001596058B|nr:DUF3320 domain-containing protein [Rhodococcus erythropolis]QSE39477.1 DUF3320 domain-containing protein [Rhodococcus erythropolis]